MLHRLIHKSPVPLESYPYDSLLFDPNGHIRRRFIRMCYRINLNPDDLFPKTLDDFAEKGQTENVQVLRYNEYENKRRAKIDALMNLVQEKRQRYRTGTYNPEDLKGLFPQLLSNSNRKHVPGVNIDLPTKTNTSEAPTPFNRNLTLALDRVISGDSSVVIDSWSRRSSNGYFLVGKSNGTRSNRNNNSNNKGSRLFTMSNGGSEDEGDVSRMLEEEKRRKMINRSVQKERQMNASVLVTKKEEEYREKTRKVYEEKEEKWYDKKFKMLCVAKHKKKQDDWIEKERKDRIRTERKEEERSMLRRQKELVERLEHSDKKRKEENEKKHERYKEINRTFDERHRSVIKKKEYEDQVLTTDLQEIEKKLAESLERKERHVEEKKVKALRSSWNVEERIKKVILEKEMEEQRLIQEIGKKLQREKQRSQQRSISIVNASKRQKDSPRAWRELEVQARLKEIKAQERMEIKKLAAEQKEKEKKALERIQNNKANVANYIAERREIRKQKMNHARDNTALAAEVYEKWIEDETKSRKDQSDKLDQVLFTRELTLGYDKLTSGKDNASIYSWKS